MKNVESTYWSHPCTSAQQHHLCGTGIQINIIWGAQANDNLKEPSHFGSKFQWTQCCLLLLMNMDTLHMACPADSYCSLSIQYSRPMPASCSLHEFVVYIIYSTNSWWITVGFWPLICKNLITLCTSVIHCFVVTVVMLSSLTM